MGVLLLSDGWVLIEGDCDYDFLPRAHEAVIARRYKRSEIGRSSGLMSGRSPASPELLGRG